MKIVTSLNIIAWLKSHDIEVEEKYKDDFYYAQVEQTQEVKELMNRYYDNEELHLFLNQFKNIKKNKANRKRGVM
ncbi:DUF5659 domain-containing protein [Cellulosilyticum lentocellum]|uniref:DUF5659 domain-containing protein n=1 Tax=Cellulosilyticum lentocellum (strain ATCC 49066 / DSM 5427 / NCIMB 11756 / RHM5) TaxID=642492 RepID=F2JSS5_CELLD|nr:DUF5659 domain-containing protein [Cellulosilyticum lentocellum]ADZ82909.1 hypothetical protein Clole_1180 [Cellulosilyticum lentocellum DSM 5427]